MQNPHQNAILGTYELNSLLPFPQSQCAPGPGIGAWSLLSARFALASPCGQPLARRRPRRGQSRPRLPPNPCTDAGHFDSHSTLIHSPGACHLHCAAARPQLGLSEASGGDRWAGDRGGGRREGGAGGDQGERTRTLARGAGNGGRGGPPRHRQGPRCRGPGALAPGGWDQLGGEETEVITSGHQRPTRGWALFRRKQRGPT